MNALFRVGVVGSVVAALCCAGILTPLLAAGLTAAGLGALTRNLDLVIFPALAVFLVLAGVGWWLREQRQRHAGTAGTGGNAARAVGAGHVQPAGERGQSEPAGHVGRAGEAGREVA
jgi:high-affinity Fe2+/Pb2+ permease